MIDFCESCFSHPHLSALVLQNRINSIERKHSLLQDVCRSCCGVSPASADPAIQCVSVDCPVLYSRLRSEQEVQFTSGEMKKRMEHLMLW